MERSGKTARLSVDDGAKARRRSAGDVFRVSGFGIEHAGRVPPYPDGGDGLGEAKADFTDAVIDNAFRGGYIAGRYLIERGHREIGVIPGPLERNTGAGRLAGFMQAMKEAHISVPENWIVQGDFEPESGYRAMQQILNQQHRPTAVFCGGDIMAMGAICAADEMGLRVPQDISLIGYDNVRNARYFSPALTTIHQPKDSSARPHLTCC